MVETHVYKFCRTVNLVTDLAIRSKDGGPFTNQCAEIICDHPTDNMDRSLQYTLRRLKRKIIDHDLVVTRADNGNSVVLKRTEYDRQMLECLTNINATHDDNFF